VRKLALPLVLLPLALAACGEDGGGAGLGDLVQADPAYFENQVFECGDPKVPPSCPPFTCEVDEEGRVSDCVSQCAPAGDNYDCTVFLFTGPEGLDLCVPLECVADEEGRVQCSTECAPDDITCYFMDPFRVTCGS
jgi:hypothetical protein